LFERLRQEAPVHYVSESPFGPYWAVSKYRDIMHCEVHHDVYSSELGGIQIEDPPKEFQRPSFIRMDPPRHDEQRKVVSPIVGPNNLVNMEPLIRERTRIVLEALPRNETFDWVEHVSIELTTMMLATLFDFPFDERAKLTFWSDVTVCNVRDPASPVHSEEERFEQLKQMAATLSSLFNQRRDQPPKFDLLSMLAHGEATRDMPLKEFMGNLALLIVGGNDTTRNSMTGGLLALNQFPDEYRKLQANPALLETAVPEIIRWQTPVIHMRRTATRDTELAGQRIRAGDKVVLWFISGNRDADAIENPNSFIIDRRRPRQHLSFGFGIHRCVGNRLAELQLRVIWEEILKRFPIIEVTGEPRRVLSSFVRGYETLPVRIPTRLQVS
jgi:cytochrome P450